MDKKKLKDRIFFIFLAVVVSFFILSFVLIPLADKSSHWYIVTSGSMEPTLKLGDIIYVSHVDVEEIKAGDIISFYYEDYIITHRCVKKFQQGNETYFKTKGDANEENDTFLIPEDAVIGKVPYMKLFGHRIYAKIPRIGYLSSFVHTKLGFFLLILLPAYVLIGMEVYNSFNVLFEKSHDDLEKEHKKHNTKKNQNINKEKATSLHKNQQFLKIKRGKGVATCPACNGIFYCEGLKKGDEIKCVYCGNTWRTKC